MGRDGAASGKVKTGRPKETISGQFPALVAPEGSWVSGPAAPLGLASRARPLGEREQSTVQGRSLQEAKELGRVLYNRFSRLRLLCGTARVEQLRDLAQCSVASEPSWAPAGPALSAQRIAS